MPSYEELGQRLRVPRWARPWERTKEDAAVEAMTVVRSAQSAGGSANATVAMPASPAAGNLLVTGFSQNLSLTQPTAAGYTVNPTSGLYTAGTSSVWVAYKIATGAETAATWVAGGGTGEGVCYWEIAGAAASIILDGSPVHTDNTTAATITSPTVTTLVAGSIVFLIVGASSTSGVISAWTGTNVATNISTAVARCFGGSFITTVPISSAFTANYATSRSTALLAIAIQPPVVAGRVRAPVISREAQRRSSRW